MVSERDMGGKGQQITHKTNECVEQVRGLKVIQGCDYYKYESKDLGPSLSLSFLSIKKLGLE